MDKWHFYQIYVNGKTVHLTATQQLLWVTQSGLLNCKELGASPGGSLFFYFYNEFSKSYFNAAVFPN